MKKSSFHISQSTLSDIVNDYYTDVRNSLPVLAKKYGYNQTSISRRMRNAGYILRTNSQSQLGLRVGRNHPNFKHGKSVGEYLYKRNMSSITECQNCGSEKDLLVHHLDHNHTNNSPRNLVKWCRSCHSAYHNRLRRKSSDREYALI